MFEHSNIGERVTDEDSTDESIRAAIYARTSSNSQKYGYSLDEQVNRSLSRCKSLEWQIQFVYRDEAESGKDTDRPMFQKMLEAAKNDLFDVIVFWKLDRFSRSLMHAVQLESELRTYDVALYSVTEQINTTTPTGRFNFRNIASAAEFEREMIRQRTEIGLQGMAEDHKWPNDNVPLGYEKTDKGQPAVIEREKKLVERIFDLYIKLRSMPEVATQLNEEGIPTQEGSEWTRRGIRDILRNEIYRGLYELGDFSEHVPEYQIISDEKFEEVTKIRHRFQTGRQPQLSMDESRKEKLLEQMRSRYTEYLREQSHSWLYI